ncbi:MAG TPA: DUF1501 domain-containing protein [Acidimicrobiales bacterium]|nr:DUF1501 domain-containing protein [Acidimicrobiales bacterium]|tara:strand:+ start:227 stop:1498 length:1272 start_codon:yes stop_codon:yes gene_type:complete
MSELSRRRFLYLSGGAAATAAGVGTWATLLRDQSEKGLLVPSTTTLDAIPSTSSTTSSTSIPTSPENPVLVIVQMAGGNDGLNTLVPLDGVYYDARPTLGLPDSSLISLTGRTDFGLHPSLAPLSEFWDNEMLKIIAGSGIPEQGRSHFAATDAWASGRTDKEETGWIGRWLDATEGSTPNPLRGIALGGGASILTGNSSISTVINSPSKFRLATPPGTDSESIVLAFLNTASPLSNEPALAAAQSAIPNSLDALGIIDSAKSENSSDPYEEESFSSLLETAAGLIDMNLDTQVIVVSVPGFDTHSDQLVQQQNLLIDFATGVSNFWNRIESDGHADRVLLMSTSEFGRRVTENGSGGTDHGTASVQFLIGSGKGLYGNFDLKNLVDGDLPITVDTRSVYATALDWLGGPSDEILGNSYSRLF